MAEKPIMPLLQYCASRGFTRNQAYSAAREGVIPTIRVGNLVFVPVERADRQLGLVPQDDTEASRAAAA